MKKLILITSLLLSTFCFAEEHKTLPGGTYVESNRVISKSGDDITDDVYIIVQSIQKELVDKMGSDIIDTINNNPDVPAVAVIKMVYRYYATYGVIKLDD